MMQDKPYKSNKYLIRLGTLFVAAGLPVAMWVTPAPEVIAPAVSRQPELTPEEVKAAFQGLHVAMADALEKKVALDSKPVDADAALQAYEQSARSMAHYVGKLERNAGKELAKLWRKLDADDTRGGSPIEQAAFKDVVFVLWRMLEKRGIELNPKENEISRSR